MLDPSLLKVGAKWGKISIEIFLEEDLEEDLDCAISCTLEYVTPFCPRWSRMSVGMESIMEMPTKYLECRDRPKLSGKGFFSCGIPRSLIIGCFQGK